MDIRQISSTPQGNYAPVAHETPAVADRQVASAVATVAAVQQAPQVPSPEQVSQAVQKINQSLQLQEAGLEFSIDPDSNRAIVKVIDQKTKDVIRQMPSEATLEIAKALDNFKGLLIRQRA